MLQTPHEVYCLQLGICRNVAASSLFSSRNFSRDYKERLFSLKENGMTKHSSKLGRLSDP